MTYDILNLPDDPEQLKAIIVSLHDKMDEMSVELQRLTRIIEKFFNKSSEKIAKDDSQTVKQENTEPKQKRPGDQGKGRVGNNLGLPRRTVATLCSP